MSYQKLFNNYFSTYGSQTGGAPVTAPSTTTQPSNVFNLTVAKLRPRGAYSRHRPLQAGQEFNLSTANNNTGSVPQIAAQQTAVVPQIAAQQPGVVPQSAAQQPRQNLALPAPGQNLALPAPGQNLALPAPRQQKKKKSSQGKLAASTGKPQRTLEQLAQQQR